MRKWSCNAFMFSIPCFSVGLIFTVYVLLPHSKVSEVTSYIYGVGTVCILMAVRDIFGAVNGAWEEAGATLGPSKALKKERKSLRRLEKKEKTKKVQRKLTAYEEVEEEEEDTTSSEDSEDSDKAGKKTRKPKGKAKRRESR